MARTFSPGRLEAFSDGVLAVIITIMVLELKVPHESGWQGLREVAPILAIYLLSFGFVGIYWVNHHLLIDRIHKSSTRILWSNLIWLFFASLLPFFTSWVLEKERDGFSVSLYALSLLMTGIAFMVLRVAVLVQQQAEGNVERADVAQQRKHWISMGLYVVAIPLAFPFPNMSLLMLAAVTMVWILPTLGLGGGEEPATPGAHSR